LLAVFESALLSQLRLGWHRACIYGQAKGESGVAQRSVEILIGRLFTDEAFREAFLINPSTALRIFREAGHELTRLEIDALLAAPPELWTHVANEIDPRLQKANLAKEIE
jgi:hypothetical protein